MGLANRRAQSNMKFTIYLQVLILPVLFFSGSIPVSAQDLNTGNNVQIDSMAQVYRREQAVETEQQRNSDNLSDLRTEKNEARTRARTAQRIENDASDAAKESRSAYRQEKKAQRARAQADKQTKKAAKARAKADSN